MSKHQPTDLNLHRGIRVDTLEWVYGNYIKLPDRDLILPMESDYTLKYENTEHSTVTIPCHTVLRETVGRYIGFDDKKNLPIFCGDILRFHSVVNRIPDFNGYVVYSPKDAQFLHYYEKCSPYKAFWLSTEWEYTKIGNMYENSNLIVI